MRPRIAVNGLFLTRPHTGMGRYTLGLLRALPNAMRAAEFVAFVPEKVRLELPKAVRTVVVPPGRSLLGAGKAVDDWERKGLGLAASRLKSQLLLHPYPVPETRNPYHIPVVTTVHDMIPWQLAPYRRRLRSRVKQRRVLRGIRRADHILTVSQTSATAVNRIARVSADRITVTYEGLEPGFAKRPGAVTLKEVRQRYGLARPFVLYFGGYDYRKNIRRLVEGFAASGLAESHDLVLGGAVTAPASKLYEDYRRLPQLLERTGLALRTKPLGFVSEDDKRALLTAADTFAYPSIAEGFGLPVLEALALETPVVAASIPSNQELFAEAFEPFSAEDVPALATALRRAVRRPDTAKRAQGRKYAEHYTWPAAAAATAQVFNRLIGAQANRVRRR